MIGAQTLNYAIKDKLNSKGKNSPMNEKAQPIVKKPDKPIPSKLFTKEKTVSFPKEPTAVFVTNAVIILSNL